MSLLLKETLAALEARLGGQLGELVVADLVVGPCWHRSNSRQGDPGSGLVSPLAGPDAAGRLPAGRAREGRSSAFALDRSVLKRAVGVAALNAVSNFSEDKTRPEGYVLTVGQDALDETPLGKGTRVVLVGAFAPHIRRLNQLEANFCVVERNPETLRETNRFRHRHAEAVEDAFAAAEVAIVTGSAPVNHTMDGLLALIRNPCRVVVGRDPRRVSSRSHCSSGGSTWRGESDRRPEPDGHDLGRGRIGTPPP